MIGAPDIMQQWIDIGLASQMLFAIKPRVKHWMRVKILFETDSAKVLPGLHAVAGNARMVGDVVPRCE